MDDRPTILIVDDRRENRVALEAALAGQELELVSVDSGDAALRVLLERTPAMVLMDVAMPGLDGFETATLIRMREKSRHVPIVFVTAQAGEAQHIYRGYAAGAVDYLVKPVDVYALRMKVSVFVDLWTQQRETERAAEALRDAEQRARLLAERLYDVTFEEAPIGIGHASVNGPFVRVNQRLAALLGRSSDELRAKPLLEMVHPDDRKALGEQLRRLVAGEIPRHRAEYRICRPDESSVWTMLTFSLIRDREGQPLQLTIVEDISDEKRLTVALEASEQRFARIRESGLLGFFHERPDGTVDEANDAFLDMLGYTAEDLARGAVQTAVFGGPAGGAAEQKAREQLEKTRVCPVFEHDFQGKNGRTGTMLVGAVAGDGASCFALDVTAIREAERARARTLHELEDAVRARDDFLTLASHELRTPLAPLAIEVASMRSMLQTQSQSVDARWLGRELDVIDRCVRRSEALVSSLLAFSELTVGKIRLEREELDLVALVERSVSRLSRELSRAGCPTHVDAPPALFGAWDRLRLELVIENLLSNAAKYAPGGAVEVTVSGDDAEARVAIRDHGPGIAPAEQSKVFERFTRLGGIQHHGGFGLGLWTAREIVRAHGGRIELDSALGRGACFRIVLPRHAHDETTPRNVA